MIDLIERVENHGWHEDDAPLVWEMHDEIKRLQAVVDAIKDLRYDDVYAGVKLWDEIQKLMAEQEGET